MALDHVRAKEAKMSEAEVKKALKYTIIFAGMALAFFVIDIVSKWIVQSNCALGQAYWIIPNFLCIRLSYNTGVAFGAGDNLRWLNIVISIVMSAALIFYYVYTWKTMKPFVKAVVALLISGAIGNMIDRCFYWEGTTGFNGVIDFIQFYLGGGPDKAYSVVNPFATFNIADSCLTIGVIMFLVYSLVDTFKNKDGKDDLSKDPREKESTLESNPTRENAVADRKKDEEASKQ